MDFEFDFDRQERRGKLFKNIKGIVVLLVMIAVAVAVAWLITRFTVEITNMVDDSMDTTLQRDDTILINKLAYIRSKPERFDVIVFRKDGKEHSYYSIKRVIGLPGETVLIKDGKVFINGEELKEQVIVESINICGLAENGITLEEDEYFVLGDNRNNSEDSRFAHIGNVVPDEIIGKAIIRTNKFSIISKLNLKENENVGKE